MMTSSRRMASNPTIALRLQSLRPAGRVAERGSLIWLKSVKRTVLLLSEDFHFFFRLIFTTFWIGSETGTLFLRLSMLRCVSPLGHAAFTAPEVINRTRSDAASFLRLGTRVGLVTASNDHQEFSPDRVPVSGTIKSGGLWFSFLFLS